jgi:hypothetical protein
LGVVGALDDVDDLIVVDHWDEGSGYL